MKITLFSIGTQGDVRPFVALGLGLQAAGHQVCIASGETCAPLVLRHGLDFAPLTADFLEVMARDPGALQKGLNPLTFVSTARRHLRQMSADWAAQGLAAAEGADLLLGNGMVAMLAASIGEKLGIPVVETHLQPVSPCPDIPPMMLKPPRRARPGWANLSLYRGLRLLTWQMLSAAYGPLRRQLGLAAISWRGPARNPNSRILYGFSPTLIPPSPHWSAGVKVAGNWFLNEGGQWQPPASLAAFLAAGPKPVYVGFGSMVSGDATDFTGEIISAIVASGQRAVLASGWGGLAPEQVRSPQIYCLDYAPHDWLLPRMALAVHHGGAGTTAAALRAGIPSVVVPFFGDQPFWAWRLQQLGVAPEALPRATLNRHSLAAAISAALAPVSVARAAQLGHQLQAEDGVGKALAQLAAWGLLPAADTRTRSGGSAESGAALAPKKTAPLA